MMKNTRPWLRYIEGIDGAQAGAGGQPPAAPDTENTAPAAPEKGGDQGGDKGSGDGEDDGQPPAPAAPAPPAPTPDPEPAAAPAEKPESDDPRDEAMDAMRQQLKELTEWRDAEVARARTALAADVAKAAGLPGAFAARLQGTSREELEADAKAMAAVIGQATGRGAVDPAQGRSGGGIPASIEDAIKAHYGIN